MLNINKIKIKDKNILNIRSKGQRVVFGIVFAIFAVYACTLIFPFLWVITNSFKDSMEYFSSSPFDLPNKFLISNYLAVFDLLVVNDTNFLGMIINSVWYTVGTTFISITFCAMTAYCVAKYDFKLRKLIYGIGIFILIIPIVGALPAQYKLFYELHLANSPLLLLTATGGFGFNFIVLYGFFKSVSDYYGESARIDGAGHHVVFWKIVIPQSIAPILSLAIISAIGVWNDYMTPLLYLPDFPTLSSGLYEYENNMLRFANYPVYFAGVIISMIPILCLFVAFQNTIMENVVAGGLKG